MDTSNEFEKVASKTFIFEILGSCQHLSLEEVSILLMSDKVIQRKVTFLQMKYLVRNLANIHSNNAYILNKVNVA